MSLLLTLQNGNICIFACIIFFLPAAQEICFLISPVQPYMPQICFPLTFVCSLLQLVLARLIVL